MGMARGYLLFCLFCFTVGGAVGQTLFNPNVLPLGETEALMGNTGIGGMNSPAAVYYNPGALAMLDGHSFSLSASAYTRYTFGATPIAQLNGSNVDFEARGFRSLPTSIVMVRRFGDWRVGAFVLFTSDFAYEGQTFWKISTPAGELDVSTKINYKETLARFGAAAARPLGNGWMLGVSVSAMNFSYLESEDFNSFFASGSDFFFYENQRVKISATGLLFTAGVLKQGEKWNFGVRVNAPSIDVLESGNFYSLSYQSIPGSPGPELAESRYEDLSGQYKSPFEIGVGTVFHPNSTWCFAADITFRTGLDFARFEGLPESELIRTKSNYRLNGGVRFRPGERFGYYLGATYTPSTLEETDLEAGLQYKGVYGGVKLFTEHLETSVGIFYVDGRGESALENADVMSRQEYEFLGLFIGSNYRF